LTHRETLWGTAGLEGTVWVTEERRLEKGGLEKGGTGCQSVEMGDSTVLWGCLSAALPRRHAEFLSALLVPLLPNSNCLLMESIFLFDGQRVRGRQLWHCATFS
jgi:hypothetical protein